MTRTSFYKLIIGLAALLALSACASSRERFPDYGSVTNTQSVIPVVVDLFAYRDIAGKSRGYNKELNDGYLEEAVAQIDTELAQHGFSANIFAALNGLTYEMEDGTEYVLSEDWKSNGQSFTGIQLDQAQNPWLTSATRNFLVNIFRVAREINSESDIDQAFAENKIIETWDSENEDAPTKISAMEIDPGLFEGLETDVVLFVKSQGRFQKLGKFLTKGLLVGAASGVLTGGLVVVPSGSYIITEVVAFNVKSRQILWHTRHYAEGKNAVKYSIKRALSVYPNSDGDTPYEKKRRRAKELQKRGG